MRGAAMDLAQRLPNDYLNEKRPIMPTEFNDEELKAIRLLAEDWRGRINSPFAKMDLGALEFDKTLRAILMKLGE